MAIHNHGLEWPGMSCRESMVDGKLTGACLQPVDSRDQIRDTIAQALEVAQADAPSPFVSYATMADAVLAALQTGGWELFRTSGECGHCGEPIKFEPTFKLWFHPSTGIEHCYRDPQHTEVATPKLVAAAAEREANHG